MRSVVVALGEATDRARRAGAASLPAIQVRDQIFCGPNALDGNSLVCNVFNIYPNVDISHFLFADTVHPTPYGHWLFARQVGAVMAARGWL